MSRAIVWGWTRAICLLLTVLAGTGQVESGDDSRVQEDTTSYLWPQVMRSSCDHVSVADRLADSLGACDMSNDTARRVGDAGHATHAARQ